MGTEKRISQLRAFMAEKKLVAGLIFEPDNQYYITGFKAITYSRPIVTVVLEDRIELIVPGLEEAHATQEAKVDGIHVYHEIPEMASHGISYKHHLETILKALAKGSCIGVETSVVSADFAAVLKGMGFKVEDIGNKIFGMRYIKDEQEVQYLHIAGALSDIALKGSLEAVRPGLSEMEFDSAGDRILLSHAADQYPDTYVGFANWTCSGISRTAKPHLDSNTRKFKEGDVVIHSRQVWFKGYRAENERTFFVGTPSEKQKELFNIAVEAQAAGLDTIRPGIPARKVDEAARTVIAKAGLALYANHRIGHGLGLSEHEEPYLRFDNDLILEEGMVFSIEPGIYHPEHGGFRHSDTVIITATGADIITRYPRRIDKLIF